MVGAKFVRGHIGHGGHPEAMQDVFFASNTRAAKSPSDVAPLAFGLELLMLWTDKSVAITFGITSAAGIVAGSLTRALATRQFRLEGFASTSDTRGHVICAINAGGRRSETCSGARNARSSFRRASASWLVDTQNGAVLHREHGRFDAGALP